ncbi:helix-turn-helix domain-containing protein [Nocardia sp. NRRL S-836]|uniref:helix-turn-helix domain-containing protein n=1 Tax=Nocardia sp. NRRL S-836 TaxID=1519492 RepID=UPI000A73A470|nr:XRE family transcriptional regulator [Nocardia sp. NRRL S-836]
MAAPHELPGPESVLGQERFADALRTAIGRRALTLDRLRVRLAERGVNISLATLSYWQQGRSRPERPKSLRALRELEAILDLPQGTLFEFLEPPRPRGRCQSRQAVSIRALYGDDSPFLAVAGAETGDPNPFVSVLDTNETCHVGACRTMRRLSTTQVLRCVADRADRFTVVHGADEGDAMPCDLHVRGGEVTELRSDPASGYTAAVITLARPLARGETAVLEHEWVLGENDGPSISHERRVRYTETYLLRVSFDPVAPPRRCYEYRRVKVDAPQLDRRRLHVNTTPEAHLYLPKCAPGIHGICWEWD